ncbi:MAG: hypothetical protein E7K36_12620, partial [Bacteroides sp.]|nr:hypothetical protein [Bacteroides sp.]
WLCTIEKQSVTNAISANSLRFAQICKSAMCLFYIVTVIFLTVIGLTVNAKPRCQGFNNYDNKVTIVFTDNQAKDKYTVSDVKLIPSSWSEKEYPATSVEITVKKGVATVTLTFPHVTQFSNPQVTLRINGKKSKFKVCQ